MHATQIPPTERLERLPVYAREYIDALKRDLKNAEEKARRLSDSQTETNIWVEDYGSKPDQSREFVQGDGTVCTHKDVCLAVRLYGERGIELSWSDGNTPYGCGDVAFIPTSHQQARLVHQNQMRVR